MPDLITERRDLDGQIGAGQVGDPGRVDIQLDALHDQCLRLVGAQDVRPSLGIIESDGPFALPTFAKAVATAEADSDTKFRRLIILLAGPGVAHLFRAGAIVLLREVRDASASRRVERKVARLDVPGSRCDLLDGHSDVVCTAIPEIEKITLGRRRGVGGGAEEKCDDRCNTHTGEMFEVHCQSPLGCGIHVHVTVRHEKFGDL